jgi:hypothetical protein
MHTYLKLVFLVSGLLIGADSMAQFNVKIGFNSAYSKFKVNNEILKDYNTENSFLEQGFKELHIMHGVVLGLRYRWDNLGLDISWENMSRNRDAFGEDLSGGPFMNELFYTMNSLSAGLENYFGSFGYGAALENRQFRVKTKISGLDKKKTILSQTEYSARFYLLLQIQQSNKVSLVFRPYVQYPFKAYNFDPLEENLLETSSPEDNMDKPWVFGLSIIFYNGPQ